MSQPRHGKASDLSEATPLGRSGEHSPPTAWLWSLSLSPPDPITHPCFLLTNPPTHFPEASLCSCLSSSPKGQPPSLFPGLYSISISRQLLFLYEPSILSQDKSLRIGAGKTCHFSCVCAGGPGKPHDSANNCGHRSFGLPLIPFLNSTHKPRRAPACPSSRPAPGKK